jgi:serine/threonine-protein kinase
MESPKDIHNLDEMIGLSVNKYKIAQRIGHNKVFLAFHEDSPEKQVALKVFFPDPFASNHDVILERLQAVSKLDHENIVKVDAVGEQIYGESDERNFIYAVMEYVPGENLYDLMKRNPRLHWAAAAELASDIVKGLVAAHEHQVMHRCLHPDRVLLGKSGQIKINFCNEGEITPSREVVYYVPPELFLGQDLTAESDVYSLGAIIYNIVTGNPPFSGKEPKEVALKHREHSEILPSYGVADIPHPLSLILSRSLAINPKERYSCAVELKAAFRNFMVNDIGVYKPGSYKELFRRVEVSESDKAFTREVEKVRRQKVVPCADKDKQNTPCLPQQHVKSMVSMWREHFRKLAKHHRVGHLLGDHAALTILAGLLSLFVNIALAFFIVFWFKK